MARKKLIELVTSPAAVLLIALVLACALAVWGNSFVNAATPKHTTPATRLIPE
jgi:hypothetical protein